MAGKLKLTYLFNLIIKFTIFENLREIFSIVFKIRRVIESLRGSALVFLWPVILTHLA